MSTCTTAWLHRLAPRTATNRPAAWLERHGAQEISATVATLVWGWLLEGSGCEPIWLGTSATLVEYVVFYAVALWVRRMRGSEATWSALVREYGRAELCDLVQRPLLLALGAALLPSAAVGLVAGSLAADAAFYWHVSRVDRRPGRSQRRTRAARVGGESDEEPTKARTVTTWTECVARGRRAASRLVRAARTWLRSEDPWGPTERATPGSVVLRLA